MSFVVLEFACGSLGCALWLCVVVVCCGCGCVLGLCCGSVLWMCLFWLCVVLVFVVVLWRMCLWVRDCVCVCDYVFAAVFVFACWLRSGGEHCHPNPSERLRKPAFVEGAS